jgi:hypothetical protein
MYTVLDYSAFYSVNPEWEREGNQINKKINKNKKPHNRKIKDEEKKPQYP